ncbi:mRNA triphosphatase CET1 [Lentithecium fluviatile CBS 122367]|uniref:mRNA-capping enzyme subunit beta n=1 Tax=Lentithecium fluviatile CBS 122367 TaxID=1168545 RepID=A0A6G1IBN0_9PLEO|nr:mRNA triphosphatase CET1 [Lentithecium fluviatile CBS 122367]
MRYEDLAVRCTSAASHTANMDIAALVNPVSEAPPRRSLSGSHNFLAPSPSTSSAKLPTPPVSTNNKPMNRKRKRHDPKPLWAAREDEVVDGLTFAQWQKRREQSRPAPQPQAQAPPAAVPMRNGPPPPNPFSAPQPLATRDLVGYERPVSDDAQVYDDVSRGVCDFIYSQVIMNEHVRNAIAEAPGTTQVEVEARWGQLLHKESGQRIQTITSTEAIVRPGPAEAFKFESTMTMQQHKAMNTYLNKQVQQSNAPDAMRAKVQYKHTKEEDQFFELDKQAFDRLPPYTQQLIAQSRKGQRIRVTRDPKDPNKPPTALIKLRIENMEILSPRTEWDYRIGVNLEIKYPGPIDSLRPVVEPGRDAESMKRFKDRVSYAWLDAFQIDLTQVISGNTKNHELELELNSDVLLQNGDRIQHNQPNGYESLINGLMNNLRVLSREITPPVPGA